MKLIHRTNYWGEWIDASGMDDEVPFDVIWTQAVSNHSSGCCHGFGRRPVAVVNSDFVDEDLEWWHVFRVSNQYGRTDGHYFYKFVALPQGTYGYGKRGCAALGWTWEGEFNANVACVTFYTQMGSAPLRSLSSGMGSISQSRERGCSRA